MLIRVMVVEDEPPILRSICMLLEEYGNLLQVVHTAGNGQRALEYLKDHPVDIIFSDIKMPVMNGIELARQVQQLYPEIMMVLISGFQEFEFAQSAIRYGVKSYLLKPVSKDAIAEVVDSLTAQLRLTKKDEMRKVLRQIVTGLRLPLDVMGGKKYGFLLYSEGPYRALSEGLPGSDTFIWDSAEVESYLQGLLPVGALALVVEGRSIVEKLVIFDTDDTKQVETIGKNLFYYLKDRGTLPITMLVNPDLISANEISDAYFSLHKRVHKETILFHSSFIQQEKPVLDKVDFTDWGRAMLLGLKTRNFQAVLKATTDFTCILQEQPVRQTKVLLLLDKIVLNCFEDILTQQGMEDLKLEVQAVVSGADLPEDFAVDLAEMLYTWLGTDSERDNGQLAEFCEEVGAYLRTHYKENITNKELAEQFHCSAALLSKKFKEYYGCSLSEYLNNFRVELAQSMMRENKKARIKEIAIDVGFSDQYYFSKIFKKITNVWPTEYAKE